MNHPLFTAVISPITEEAYNRLKELGSDLELKPTDIVVTIGDCNEQGYAILVHNYDNSETSGPDCALAEWIMAIAVETGYVLEQGKKLFIQKALVIPQLAAAPQASNDNQPDPSAVVEVPLGIEEE